MDRRAFLRAAVIGCSAAASPLITPVTLASAPWDGRLVVIILRGAMDGLDAVRPIGDPDYATLRGRFLDDGAGDAGALALDGLFALHPGLAPLHPLWAAGELAVAHATSTPYRDKRSHFDGQALLEAGSGGDPDAISRDGWLNRLLQISPGVETRTAFAVGRDRLPILAGAGTHSTWQPNTALNLSPQGERLLELIYHDDPLFRDAAMQALDIIAGLDDSEMDGVAQSRDKTTEVARFVVDQLKQDTRIAAFSLGGWDTHARQTRQLTRQLGTLSQTLLTLKTGLGPIWSQTAVLVMTEFGRTARINGTGGTDHGTGGAMLMAGGAIRGGQSYGRWPGLKEAELYEGRDLLPTRDIRAYAGWIMRDLFGLRASDVESTIFPGLSLETNPGLLR